MKATFEPSRRYRVIFTVPKAIEPKTLLSLLGKQLSRVEIVEAKAGKVTVEATWLGPRRHLDTDFLLSVEQIATKPS